MARRWQARCTPCRSHGTPASVARSCPRARSRCQAAQPAATTQSFPAPRPASSTPHSRGRGRHNRLSNDVPEFTLSSATAVPVSFPAGATTAPISGTVPARTATTTGHLAVQLAQGFQRRVQRFRHPTRSAGGTLGCDGVYPSRRLRARHQDPRRFSSPSPSVRVRMRVSGRWNPACSGPLTPALSPKGARGFETKDLGLRAGKQKAPCGTRLRRGLIQPFQGGGRRR